MDVVYLDFSKALDNLSHCCLLQDKLRNQGLDKWTIVKWTERWLNHQTYRAVNNLFLDLLNTCSGITQTHCTHVVYNKYIYCI